MQGSFICMQVAELQRTFTSALVTFEQRHWSALLGNEQRITNRVEQVCVAALHGTHFQLLQLSTALQQLAVLNHKLHIRPRFGALVVHFGLQASSQFDMQVDWQVCSCCGEVVHPAMQALLVMRMQTVGQIVSAVEVKLDAMRQAQEDDSYIRRALSSNASTAHWPQHGAPPAAPRDGFTNHSNDTVQVDEGHRKCASIVSAFLWHLKCGSTAPKALVSV
jgi:hypothetical protein